MKIRKKVYVGLSVDIIHEGHINILKIANKYGDITVGLLTDKAIFLQNIPHLDYKRREKLLFKISNMSKVIPQDTLTYVDNLNLIKPDFVVHGDDWKTGVQKKLEKEVIKTLKKWSGKLIEPKYTKNISSTIIKNKILEIGLSPQNSGSKI